MIVFLVAGACRLFDEPPFGAPRPWQQPILSGDLLQFYPIALTSLSAVLIAIMVFAVRSAPIDFPAHKEVSKRLIARMHLFQTATSLFGCILAMVIIRTLHVIWPSFQSNIFLGLVSLFAVAAIVLLVFTVRKALIPVAADELWEILANYYAETNGASLADETFGRIKDSLFQRRLNDHMPKDERVDPSRLFIAIANHVATTHQKTMSELLWTKHPSIRDIHLPSLRLIVTRMTALGKAQDKSIGETIDAMAGLNVSRIDGQTRTRPCDPSVESLTADSLIAKLVARAFFIGKVKSGALSPNWAECGGYFTKLIRLAEPVVGDAFDSLLLESFVQIVRDSLRCVQIVKDHGKPNLGLISYSCWTRPDPTSLELKGMIEATLKAEDQDTLRRIRTFLYGLSVQTVEFGDVGYFDLVLTYAFRCHELRHNAPSGFQSKVERIVRGTSLMF